MLHTYYIGVLPAEFGGTKSLCHEGVVYGTQVASSGSMLFVVGILRLVHKTSYFYHFAARQYYCGLNKKLNLRRFILFPLVTTVLL